MVEKPSGWIHLPCGANSIGLIGGEALHQALREVCVMLDLIMTFYRVELRMIRIQGGELFCCKVEPSVYGV